MQTSLEMLQLAGKGFTLSRPRAVPSRTSPPQLGQKVRLAGGLRSHLHLKASAAGSSSAVFGKIFNRKEELAALNLRFAKNPKDMLILLGPANCGKTKLLQEVKKNRELGQAVIGEGPPPILYLNCRKKDISSPQQFANAIRELVTKDTAFGKWWKAVKLKFPYIQVDLGTLFGPADDPAPPMASIIASLTACLEATRPLPYKPVIIIDEANVLLDWHDDPGRTQLKALLRFFVATTKEDHLGHFVLASSESFVIDFLEKEGLHTKQYVTKEIGDLATIDEAKQFVESLMLCKTAPSSFFDTTENGEQIDMWPRVYEICGGNIGLLERCAEYANDIGSWENGLEEVSTDLEGAVQRGLWPGAYPTSGSSHSPATWTKEDYKTVLREIVLAKDYRHAVSFKKLQNALGEKAVRSMVEWNLLSVRRKSLWAKDLPATLFIELNDTKLVTMPSPVELYFILKMYDDGELDAASPNDDK